MPVNSFECSQLFVGSEHATAHVENDQVTVVVSRGHEVSYVTMKIDLLQNFIEKCRRAQQSSRLPEHNIDSARDTRPSAAQSSDNR